MKYIYPLSIISALAFPVTLMAAKVTLPNLSDSSKVHDIEEVTVVSQPKEVFRLRQQPLSSTSVSHAELTALGLRDLRELSNFIPSFTMPEYGSRLTSSVYVRGIGSRVNSPAVGIYVDDMPILNKSAFNFHFYDIDRVDVLRGPQGVLYGQNTEGGVIRIYSKNPFNYQGTDMHLGWGSHFWRNVEATTYQKINDKFAFSFGGFYDGQNGFFKNITTGQRADQFNEAGGRFRLMYRPTNRLTYDFITDYQYVRQNGFPYGILNVETNETSSPSTNLQSNYRRNILNTGLNIIFKANAFDFTSASSYQYLKDYMLMDQDYLPVDYMKLEQRQFQNAFTQDFSFKSNHGVGGFWHWTLGTFFSAQWLKTQAPVYFDKGMTDMIGNAIRTSMVDAMIAAGMPSSVANGVQVNVHDMEAPGLYRTPQYNLAFYHESNFDITKRLTATFGLRYDYLHTKLNYDAAATMGMKVVAMGMTVDNMLTSAVANRIHDDFNQLLPKFGLNYTFDKNNSNVYASVSKGYRAGGYNIQMFSDVLQTELDANRSNAQRSSYNVPHTEEDYENIAKTITYKPETIWNYEVGTHLNLFSNSIHLDIAAYYMQIRNQQLSVMSSRYGFGRMMVNAGKSHSAGVEATLRGSSLNNHLNWGITYSYTRAVFQNYTDSVVTNGITTVVDYKGKHVPYAPLSSISSHADYCFNIASTGLHSIIVGANVYAQGKTYWDEANTYYQKLYAVLGAHADADFGFMTLSLWGRNLTNSKYNTFAFNSSATGSNNYFAQKGNPFQFGVDVNFHF